MVRSHSPERSRERDAPRKRERSPAPDARDGKRRRSHSRERGAAPARDNRTHERTDGYRGVKSPGESRGREEHAADSDRDARRREPDNRRSREPERERERDRDRDRGPRAAHRDRPRDGRDGEPRGERGREPDRRAGDAPREPERLREGAPHEAERGHGERAEARPRESNRERDMREARERLAARERGRAEAPARGRPGAEDGETNGGGAAKKGAEPPRQPLSLDELLKKRQREEAALSKPKFLSKKEREELAKKEAEDAAQLAKAKAAGLQQAHSVYVDNVERERREREERRQNAERRRRDDEREREKQVAMIKAQYLGAEKQKKKVLKPSEKFRFNFDWEARDDTSRDLNPLYQQTHEAALLYGRGMRAGIDRREQKKAGAELERATVAKIRKTQGLEETREDRMRDRERIRAADAFDDFDRRVEKHWTEKELAEMTERDWRIFREDFSIAYKGVSSGMSALPIRNWKEATLPPPVMQAVEKLGYEKPSPIQMAAIPLGLQFRDVIGVAETGSGKTAAFVLPMLTYIMKQPVMTEALAAEGPYAVIMAPTRELALQIEEEARKLAQFTDYRMVSVVGGQNIEEQGFKLRKGCEIIIATPGRLLDCLEQRYAVLNQCNYIVLDEADRMIDLGFEPQVMAVMDAMPSSNLRPEDESEVEASRVYRTTYMFSATMPPTVERLARKYMRKPVTINIGSAGKATDNVTQHIIIAKDNDKPRLLEDWINEVDEKRVIVFVNSKRACDIVYKQLDTLGYRCTVLHSGKTQDQRESGMAGFREEKYNVLVATDVAGRGIDVPDVAAVINYDMPHTIEGYTHRIGRTGRAGKKGFAVTFLTMGDTEVFYDLKRLLEDSNANIPPQLARHEASKNKPGSVTDKPKREQITYAA